MIVLFGSLFILLILGVPVFAALGISSLAFAYISDTPLLAAGQLFFEGLNSFPLLAVPFFVLAANLMNSSGITERLFRFANNLVGFVPGGLGHVNIVASVIFSGMSGTALADAAGLGTIEVKAMRDRGYDAPFAVGITAASSVIGPLIPPSLPLLIYGVTAGVSIGQLFLAGLVPGLLVALALHVMVFLMSLRRGYPREPLATVGVLFTSLISSLPVLAAPAIIIGGIALGIFTPTEAAVVASIYAIVIGSLVYRTLGFRSFVRELRDCFETTATMMVMLGSATLFGWLLVRAGAASSFAEFAISFAGTPTQLLLVVNVVLFICGLVLDPVVIILVATPILLPSLDAFGIDRVHFGIVMLINVMIGMMTPPIGVLAFVMAKIGGLDLIDTFRALMPFLVPVVIVAGLITFLPQITLFVPELVFGE